MILTGADLRTMWRIVNRGALDYGNPTMVALEQKLGPDGYRDALNTYGPTRPQFDNWVCNLAVVDDGTLDHYAARYQGGPNELLAAWHKRPDADPRMASWPALFTGIGRT